MKTITNYTINSKYNGNFITYYVNFENGTYAKLVVIESQGLKRTNYKQHSITGNYNKSEINVSMGRLGEVIVVPVSKEKATVNEILNHSIFGKVEIITSKDGKLEIKVLKTDEIKYVMEKFFMNGII